MSAPVADPESGAGNSRQLNRRRLLDAIRRLGPISRADLAKLTRLSPPTVSALVEGLVGGNRPLREIGTGVSSGGRPPILLEFNADYGRLIGVDIGARFMRFALTDLQGRVIVRDQQRTRADSWGAAIDQLLAGLSATCQAGGCEPSSVFAIGLSAPGPTDVERGRVASAANLPGWVDVPLADHVGARFPVPIRVDSAPNMAAVGEQWLGVARDARDFVFLTVGAGIGAGVVMNGRLHRGHRFAAGDLSRMTLDYRAWDSDVGQRGYLASRIGAEAVPHWVQARPLVTHAGADSETALRTIFDLARHGDSGALTVVDELAVFLGTAVANVIVVLDPQLVVFGGALSHAGDVLMTRVRRVVSRIVSAPPALEPSALADDAPLYGCIASAMAAAESRVLAGAAVPAAAAAGEP